MHRSTALTAFAALGLTVIAGLTATAVTLDHGASAPPAAVQYVDQYGNPVAAPATGTAASAGSTSGSTSSSDRSSTVVVRHTDGDDDGEGGED